MKSIIDNIQATLPHDEQLRRAESGSFGYDLKATSDAIVHPGKISKISTGVRLKMKPHLAGLVLSRSGLSSKGIIVTNAPGLIDYSYSGEVMVLLSNLTNEPFYVHKGDKIAQMIFVPVELPEVQKVTDSEMDELHLDSERGSGGFGSTGLK
jgi:dUTP pyrophosphatase